MAGWGMAQATLPTVLGVVAYIAVFAVALRAVRASYPHRNIGLCNAVTLLRLVLASVLIAAVFAPQSAPWLVLGVATAAFALDGLDGWLARRAHLSSAFGARFDMEVDAILALTLSVLVYLGGEVGAYVLLLGLPRYIFWIAQFPLPWLNGDLPERFSRKVVCVLQIGTLLALLLPFVTGLASSLLAGIAVAALIWSFGVDVRLLMRARG
jgi:phosphatidylglycerophosphate synthase